jgi:hypothetical protein
MPDPVEALILDLLDWLTVRDRTYEEVMAAWRTSCPRLPVWEEANDRGLIMREEVKGSSMIRVSSSGLALLDQLKRQKTNGVGSIKEPRQRPRAALDDLLARCNPKAPHSKEEREWLADKPTGRELI